MKAQRTRCGRLSQRGGAGSRDVCAADDAEPVWLARLVLSLPPFHHHHLEEQRTRPCRPPSSAAPPSPRRASPPAAPSRPCVPALHSHSRSAPPRHHRTRSSSPLTYLHPSHAGPARHVDVQADGPGRDQADGVERAQDGRKGGGPRVGVAVAGASLLSGLCAVIRAAPLHGGEELGGRRLLTRPQSSALRADAPLLLPRSSSRSAQAPSRSTSRQARARPSSRTTSRRPPRRSRSRSDARRPSLPLPLASPSTRP